MDSLEKIIIENRTDLSNRKMPKGHLNRFENRIGAKKGIYISRKSLWAAASILIIVASSLPFLMQTSTLDNADELCRYSDEVCEMQVYFTSSINHSRNLLELYRKEGIADDNEMNLLEDELNDLDEIQKQISEDLKIAPDDERVISALIDVYRQKQSLINTILFQLNEAKKQKYKQDDLSMAVEL